MKTFLNVWWHLTAGWLFALFYALMGLFYCCTIILFPIGIGWLQFAKFLLAPHSRAMVSKKDLALVTGTSSNVAVSVYSTIISILYFPFGLVAAIISIVTIIGMFVTILGIPNGLVWARSFKTIFKPIGKVCVPKSVANEIERIKEEAELGCYTDKHGVKRVLTADDSLSVSSVVVKEENKRNEVRKYSDERLVEIIEEPSLYSTALVEECRHEMDVRKKSEVLRDKVVVFNDEKLSEILTNKGNYADEIVYCCEMEYNRRMAIRHEQDEEEKRVRKAKMKKTMIWVLGVVAAVFVIVVIASQFTASHYFKSGMDEFFDMNGSKEKAISLFARIGEKSDYYDDAQIQIYRSYIALKDTSMAVAILDGLINKKGWECTEVCEIYAEHLRNGDMSPYIEYDLHKAADFYMNSPYERYRERGRCILSDIEKQRVEAERKKAADRKKAIAEQRRLQEEKLKVEEQRIRTEWLEKHPKEVKDETYRNSKGIYFVGDYNPIANGIVCYVDTTFTHGFAIELVYHHISGIGSGWSNAGWKCPNRKEGERILAAKEKIEAGLKRKKATTIRNMYRIEEGNKFYWLDLFNDKIYYDGMTPLYIRGIRYF